MKKIIVLLLMLTMLVTAVALTSCSDDGDSDATTTTTTTTTTTLSAEQKLAAAKTDAKAELKAAYDALDVSDVTTEGQTQLANFHAALSLNIDNAADEAAVAAALTGAKTGLSAFYTRVASDYKLSTLIANANTTLDTYAAAKKVTADNGAKFTAKAIEEFGQVVTEQKALVAACKSSADIEAALTAARTAIDAKYAVISTPGNSQYNDLAEASYKTTKLGELEAKWNLVKAYDQTGMTAEAKQGLVDLYNAAVADVNAATSKTDIDAIVAAFKADKNTTGSIEKLYNDTKDSLKNMIDEAKAEFTEFYNAISEPSAAATSAYNTWLAKFSVTNAELTSQAKIDQLLVDAKAAVNIVYFGGWTAFS